MPASGLVSDDALTDLAELATQELTGREGIDTGNLDGVFQDVEATDGAVFADLSFTEDGDLVADSAKGAVTTPAAGPQQVVIAGAAADPLLSEPGGRARRQTTDPDGQLDLGAAGDDLDTNEASVLPDLQPVDCTQAKCVALTFDDGPGQYTERLLSMLAEHDVQATFYVVGQDAEARPEVLSQQAAAGHEVQNHTWNHPDLTTLTRAGRRSQIDRASAAVEHATGQQPTELRPPYGAWNAVRKQAGLPLVLWSVDPEDWKYRDSDRVADHVLSTTRPGDIVFLHDIHETTVDAVPAILEGLSEQGYQFVTVSELFGEPLEDGEVYRRNEAAYGR